MAGDHHHPHDHTEPPSEIELRVKSLESLMVEKGLVDPATLDALIDMYEHQVGPRNGAQVIAKAWADPDFKRALLASPTPAIESLGFAGRQGEHMKVVENTPEVHNLVVCTLCSCYPWPVLGLPPVWYKSAPYRSKAVLDPRGVPGRVRDHLARRGGGQSLGFDLGDALSRVAPATRGNRGMGGESAGRAGD